MRTSSLPSIAFGLLLSLTAFSTARGQLIAGWNFNDSIPPAADLIVDHGAGTLSLSGLGVAVGLPIGTTVNAYGGDASGKSLAATVASLSSNGYALLNFSTIGTAAPVLSYASGTTVASVNLQWAYSTNGISYTNFGGSLITATISSTSDLSLIASQTVDFTSIGALAGQSQVFLRGTFSNSALSAASLVIDNIQITATAIPEPSTYALWCGGLLGLLVVARRRIRAGVRPT